MWLPAPGIVPPEFVSSSVWEKRSVWHFSATFWGFGCVHVVTVLLCRPPGVFSTMTSVPTLRPVVDSAFAWFLLTRVVLVPLRVTVTRTVESTTDCSVVVVSTVSYLPSGRSSFLCFLMTPSAAAGASASLTACARFTSETSCSSIVFAVDRSDVIAFETFLCTVTLNVQSSLGCTVRSMVSPSADDEGDATITATPDWSVGESGVP